MGNSIGGSTLWTLRQWAQAIAALATTPPFPARTVFVPRLRVGHALRRELILAHHAAALTGTTFLTPVVAAREMLAIAGVELSEGEEALRPVRLAQLLSTHPPLTHFKPEHVQGPHGWDSALAATVNELEAARVSPAGLRTVGNPRSDDLAWLQETLAAEEDDSVTTAGLLLRAEQVLRQGGTWPYPGHALVVVTGHESAAEAAFLAAVPRAQRHLLGARPMRSVWRKRVEALFGPEFATASAPPEPHGTTELSLLQAGLFADPSDLSALGRRHSAGPDGSVDLEEHSGVEAELEATADWVVRQVSAGVPLGQVAVLVPHADPLVSMVRARLQRIPWGDAPLPVFIAGGEPAVGTAVGTRLLALLRTLRSFLSNEVLPALLPSLRLAAEDARHLDRDDALTLVSALGTLGGSAESPHGALSWLPAARKMAEATGKRIADLKAAQGKGEEEAEARDLWAKEKLYAQLTQLDPALAALHGLAKLVVEKASLSELWAALERFLFEDKHLKLHAESIEVAQVLRAAMRTVASHQRGNDVRGADAVALIESTLRGLRRSVGRFGQPAVYVGTVRGATGLGFDAVRIIGLAEGSIPAAPREDAVLGPEVRDALGTPALSSRELRGLLDVHALFRVVLETKAHVSLSYPRADNAGSVHEASSIFIEAMVALGRPDSATGNAGAPVPTARDLERDAFSPARRAQRTARIQHPVGAAPWLDRVARDGRDMPAFWATPRALSPVAMERLLQDERSALDGYLGDEAQGLSLRGLSKEEPISASRLEKLLTCPHRFLLESVIGWKEPAEAQPIGSIDVLTFGTLVHRVLEHFGRDHGDALPSKSKKHWLEVIHGLAEEEFARLLEGYALLGDAVRQAERRRLFTAVDAFFEEEWKARATRKFVDVERAFGVPDAMLLKVGKATLYVRGYIDRLDREPGYTLIRDYKSGKPHPRSGDEAGPVPSRDVQLGLYGLVTKQLAKEWKVPATVGLAYAYPSPETPVRAFIEDAEVLEEAAKEWLGTAHQLLTERVFPRAPDAKACTFCAFAPVCTSAGPERSRKFLEEPIEAEGGLVAMWQLEGDDGETE